MNLNVELQDVSVEVWDQNYRAPGELTMSDSRRRVADSAASNEDPAIAKKIAEQFFWLLDDGKASPGGRVTANLGLSGRDGTTLFNCYLFGPSPDFGMSDPDSINGIYSQLLAQALTLKSEGGYGTNFSYIRPAGCYIAGIGARTPGVLSFMELWNQSSKIITQGSEKILGERKEGEKKKIRKGAQMAQLEVWHPEIEDFIDGKLTEGRFDKFNFSVAITEGFMEAVVADDDWNLIFPNTDIVEYEKYWYGDILDWKRRGLPVVLHKTLKARDLWDKIMLATFTRNEPGVMFLDIANALSPLSYGERIVGSNPCFHGDERFLTENGYLKFKDSANNAAITIVEKVITDNKVSYFDNGAGEVPSNWKIDLTKKQTTVRETTPAFITKEFSDLVELTLSNGQIIRCTPDHHIATTDGMVEAKDLGDHKILVSIPNRPPVYVSRVLVNKTEEFKLGESYEISEYILNNSRKEIGLRYLAGVMKNAIIYTDSLEIRGGAEFLRFVQLVLHSIGIWSTIEESLVVCGEDFNTLLLFVGGNINRELCTNAPPVHNFIRGFVTLVSRKEIEGDTVYCIKEPVTRSIIVNTVTTRRCGEALLPVGGLCCLLSYNLVKYVKEENGNLEFDFDKFRKAVAIGSRMLDNIIDLSNLPLEAYGVEARNKRRLGAGVLGLGSLLYILGIRYGSSECLEFVEKLFRAKCEVELLTSAELGREKGSFPLFSKEEYFNTKYWKTLDIDPEVKKAIESIGCMRNSHQSANAPTGNMGVYLGVVSGGIEPVIFWDYTRWVSVTDMEKIALREQGFNFPDNVKGEWFETEILKEKKKGTDTILKGIFNGVNYEFEKNRGLIKGVLVKDYGWKFVQENLPKEKFDEYNSRNVFETSETLSVKEHIDVLAVISKYTNQNSSKTVNVPNNYSYAEFKNLYMDAWRANIKGITTYRAGTMAAVLEKKEDIKEQIEIMDEMSNDGVILDSVSLPEEYPSKGYVIRDSITKKKWYITLAFWDESCTKPFAIFVNTNCKEGSEVVDATVDSMYKLAIDKGVPEKWIKDQRDKSQNQSNVTKIARSIGLCLRHNIPMLDIVTVLDDGNYPLSSLTFHIKRLLKGFIKEGTDTGLKCSDCGGSLIMQGSCYACLQCNKSKCG